MVDGAEPEAGMAGVAIAGQGSVFRDVKVSVGCMTGCNVRIGCACRRL
jgi:hypothetical protein